MTLLEAIYNIPDTAVIALESISNKKVYLTYAHDTGLSIGRIKKIVAEMGGNVTRLKLRFFEAANYRNNLLVHLAFYEQKYLSEGWKLYKPVYGLYYKVCVDLTKDFKVMVSIVTKRGNRECVGIFENMEDADDFVTRYYSNRKVIFPVYAINPSTRKMHQNFG